MPAVSIVIPVYNLADCIGQAIDNLQAQSFGDFEVILVDDGSTDQSVAVINAHAGNDQRFHLLRQPSHRGAGAARNRGLDAAWGGRP